MIATPLYEHAHITIDALHAGKHVFCEKSMAMTCADCLDMYNVFKESGKVMFIGQQRLYDPKIYKGDGNDPCRLVGRDKFDTGVLVP